jgi:uncharacterized protein (TIGR01777 family)
MAKAKRVIVTGATGLIGKRLCAELIANGDHVVVFSRDPEKARKIVPGAVEYVAWTPAETGPWTSAVEGADAVIHLAGAPVFGKRWSQSYKAQIRDTRVLGTRGLVNALAAASAKPSVFVCGTAVGFYGFRDDTKLDESATPGSDFLAKVCIAWEQEARWAKEFGIRTVIVRSGIVLDPKEGALAQMMLPYRFFVGGPILPGRQWFPWIHIDDEVGLIRFALDDERVRGTINAVAPEQLTNRDFSRTLGKVMGRPSLMPAPGFALRVILGGVAGMLTEGQRVVPAKAQQLGYRFKYPTAEEALRHLLKRPASTAEINMAA